MAVPQDRTLSSPAGRDVAYSWARTEELTRAARERGGMSRFAPAADVAAADRWAGAEDRRRALAARVLARLLAARVLGRPPAAARALESTVAPCVACGAAHGKPGLAGTETSWSRSGDWVMAVAGLPAARGVGADIERVPGAVFAGFDRACLTARERGGLPARDDAARMRLWVAKEALLKATGHGLSVPPNLVDVAPDPGGEDAASSGTGRCPSVPELHSLAVSWPAAPEGYAAAVAAPVGSTVSFVDWHVLLAPA